MALHPAYLQALSDESLDEKFSQHTDLIAHAGFPHTARVQRRALQIALQKHPDNGDLHRQVKIFGLLNITAVHQEHYDPKEAQKK